MMPPLTWFSWFSLSSASPLCFGVATTGAVVGDWVRPVCD
jgi:hypothetical protein